MTSDWYHDFFEGITLELWDKACPIEQTRIEVGLIEKLLQPAPDAKFLDVPCGFGRHTLELLAKGYDVTAIDLANETTRRLKEESVRYGTSVRVMQKDMRNLGFESEFDCAYCLGNSFGYFNRQGTKDFFGSVAKALKPGGRFLLETGIAAESLLPNLDERNWIRIDDILMLIENQYLVEDSCLKTTYSFLKEGRRVETAISYHFVFSVGEISDMLRAVGLEPTSYSSGTDLEAYEVGSNDLLLVAENGDSR
jgi:SAM-dependent methyltransferase